MKTVGRGRCGGLAVLALVATLFAAGAHAQSDRPKPSCNGALVSSPSEIIAACTDYIAANPSRTSALARAYTWRGRAYEHSDEPDRAIEDLNRAIDIEPSAIAFKFRANAYRMKGDAVRALADYDRSLALEQDELAWVGIAKVQVSQERYDLAVKAMDEAIKLRPGDAALYWWRGNVYRDSGQYTKAIQDYDKILEMTSLLEEVRAERCLALALMGKPQEGLGDCDRAVEKVPQSTFVLLNRGIVYLRLNRLDDAIADFEHILKVDPDEPGALYARGIARRRKGDIAGGDADFKAVGAAAGAIASWFEKMGVWR